MSWQLANIDSIKSDAPYSLVGGPFGSNLTTRDYVEEGVPVIRGANLPDSQTFLDDSFVYVREEKADTLVSNLAYPGDLVFTQRGTLGQVGLIPREARFERYVISQSQMKLTVDETKADPWFVYYYFRHPDTVQTIKNHALTSGVPHINLGILKALQMPLPPLDVQKSVVALLSAYDDLIENNRRRMALLEEAARQLYREWFVRLRFPGHEHTRIVDGLPQGWTRQPIASLVLGIYDGPHATPPTADHGPVFLGIQNITESGRLDLSDIKYVSEHDFPRWTKRVTPRGGDIVFSYEATLHRYALIPPGLHGCLGRRLGLIRPDPGRNNSLFLFQSLLGEGWRGTVENNVISGATVDRIPIRKLPNFPLLTPPSHLVHGFEDRAVDSYRQIQTLSAQNERLKAARDLLLPRLMSGEIAV